MTKLQPRNTRAAKLTDGQVREMYQELLDGATQGACARKWGISVIQVGRIARGEARANATGARDNPVPNFNLQTLPGDADASLARLQAMMLPPGPAYPPDQEPDGSGLAKLNKLSQPTALDKSVGEGLDKLEKGD